MRKIFALAAALAVLAALPGCTPKEKKRAPGPLLVWVAAEDDDEISELRLLADDFSRETKIPIELVTKTTYQLEFSLRHPEDFAGVDVVDVDYFDLEVGADQMADLKPVLEKIEGSGRFFTQAFTAGKVGGRQAFIPWRLSWPAMVSTSEYAETDSFPRLADRAEADQVTMLLPALNDRDLFSLLCAVAWSVGADPEKGDRMSSAMTTIAKMALVVPMESAATGVGGAAGLRDKPAIIFDWPAGALALGTIIPLDMDSSPLPCGKNNCVPFTGRFLASPKTAPHPDDAIAFVRFMISTHAQSRLPTSSAWLPVRNDGFSDLAGRADPLRGFVTGGNMLRPLPRSPKVQKALVAAGRKILFEGATAEQGLAEFDSP